MSNVYLKVDFTEKDQVRLLGGRWDNVVKKWYVPSGLNLNNFSKWLIGETAQVIEPINGYQERGITLSQLLQKVNHAIKQINPQIEWIKAEVSEVSLHTTGHCYLELVETENGRLLSKAKAMINKDDYPLLVERFKRVTGDFLKSGMHVLVLVKFNFSVQYGFNLYIKDLDPAYTLGDLAAKLAKIRALLQKEGIYQNNKKLKMPIDFTKVAVLSPNAAAGLGDFKREAALLQNYSLCDFYYYTAQFQGVEASLEIANALTDIFIENDNIKFDVIVIIRGGGSAIDLAWLNDYKIAKLICESPVVIYSGIGHERDNTIIDEVAGCRFDTPSQVIGHIFSTIVHNAKVAIANAIEISTISNNLYLSNYNITKEQLNKILKTTEFSVLQTAKNTEDRYNNILINSQNSVKLSTNLIKQYLVRIYEQNTLQLKHIQANMIDCFNNINTILPQLYLQTNKELPTLWHNIIALIVQNYLSNNIIITTIFQDLRTTVAHQYQQTILVIQELITNIISLGPQATLRRGYVIIRDPLNKVLNSKIQAQKHHKMQVEFYDGILNIIKDSEE